MIGWATSITILFLPTKNLCGARTRTLRSIIWRGTDSHGRSVVTLYAHNSSILVGTGQTVKKGQQIAKSGSTGNSTGPHSHFEIRLNGTRVNPTYYLSK